MSIPEPKVEHHEGRGIRSCPIFPSYDRSSTKRSRSSVIRASLWLQLRSIERLPKVVGTLRCAVLKV